MESERDTSKKRYRRRDTLKQHLPEQQANERRSFPMTPPLPPLSSLFHPAGSATIYALHSFTT